MSGGYSRSHKENGHHYWISGGWNGFGWIIIGALTNYCVLEARRADGVWTQSFAKGEATSELTRIRDLKPDEKHGIKFRLQPDYTIFDQNDFDFDVIAQRLDDLSLLIPTTKFILEDRRENKRMVTFSKENGMVDWVKSNAENPIHDVVMTEYIKEIKEYGDSVSRVIVRLAFQFTRNNDTHLRNFLNTHKASHGGTDIKGLKRGFLCTIYPDKSTLPKWEKISNGLVILLHVLHPNGSFEDHISMNVFTPEVETLVSDAVKQAFDQNPDALHAIRAHLNA